MVSSRNVSSANLKISSDALVEEWLDALLNPVAEMVEVPDVVDWAEENFYIIETKRPIILEPVQRDVLRLFFEQVPGGGFKWKTGLYSTVKKSGKTTVGALVQRWAAECWGDYGEIYHMGNKLEQAKQRAYKITRRSIELSPFAKDWEIKETTMTYLNRSFIKALPINAAGESGGNQRLTVWTEFHGYRYEEDERMWDEMQPVPTQPLSFRFVESYAGYESESNLLWNLWDLALTEGVRLHDEYPIYGVESAGLIAYIDTGIEARRMPWQQDPEYYAKLAKTERPGNYKRLHLNEWVSSQEALVPMPMWDALETDEKMPLGTGVVVACDAAVSGDCTAVVAVYPNGNEIIEIETWVFAPPDGGKIDYDLTLKVALEAMIARYRVVAIVYDEYQLHHYMTQMAKAYKKINFEAFPQTSQRTKADTAMVNRIQQGTLRHSGNEDLRTHIQNSDAKYVHEGSALRIVKRSQTRHIDAAVALSMASWRASEIKPAARAVRARSRGLYKRRRR